MWTTSEGGVEPNYWGIEGETRASNYDGKLWEGTCSHVHTTLIKAQFVLFNFFVSAIADADIRVILQQGKGTSSSLMKLIVITDRQKKQTGTLYYSLGSDRCLNVQNPCD